MNQPLISVIVPIYNVAKYLPRCVDSICNQTYQNLEIILVDDGSTDNSLEICNRYAVKDKRIIVIHQKNGGLSAARNTGMDHMHGELFTFIDSDDWITPDYCQVLFDLINQSEADVSTANYTLVYDDGSQSPYRTLDETKIFSGFEDLFEFGLKVHHTAWLKLYRTSICGSLRFNPYYSLNEDLDFYFRLCQTIHSLAYTPQRLLYYFQRDNSLIHKADVSGRWKIFMLFLQIEAFCEQNHFKTCAHEVHSANLEYGHILSMLLAFDKPFISKQSIQKMHGWIIKNRQEIFHKRGLKTLGKIYAHCFSLFPHTTIFLCRLPLLHPILRALLHKRLSIK